MKFTDLVKTKRPLTKGAIALQVPLPAGSLPGSPLKERPPSSFRAMLENAGTSFSLKEQTFFFKRLAFLINASVPLLEGLHVLRDQASSRAHIKLFDKLIADVSEGQSLSRSFAKFPNVFSDFSVSIIKVGEQSGTLSFNLEYLAEELKKKQILKRKVIGAFIYPALITLATLGITAFLMLYLFPKITPIFASLHANLPLSTRVVMSASLFLQHWGLEFLIGVVCAVMLISFILKKSNAFHTLFDRGTLKIPVIGSMVQYYNISNLSRTLGLLLKSGIKLSEAVVVTADATTNRVYKKELHALLEVVERGDKISLHLKKRRRYFPSILCHMVAVGERSGTLSETLLYLADMYDNEVDEFTKNLSTLIEPVLMVFMGVLVGFIAVSIITPIYGITQNLQT